MADDAAPTQGMTPEQISEALQAGDLNGYLSTPTVSSETPRAPRGVDRPTHGKRGDEILKMLDAGELDAYLRARR